MAEKRKMRTLATRRRWARRFVDSGLTQREFAEQHGLTQGSLSRWIWEFKRADEGAGEFVEVRPEPMPAVSVRVRVGGVTIEFDQLPPAEYVAALGRAAC